MYTLISGSPKIKDSNSKHFLEIIKSKLNADNIYELKNNNYDNIINSINKSEIIVLAFPLYVDSPPTPTLAFMDYIIDNNIKIEGKKIYTIINCGFREGEQNKTAVEIVKMWCKKVDATYACSILIGAGEVVGKDKFKFISRKVLKNINKFIDIIKNKEIKDDIITTMDLFNNKIYCYVANIFWNKKGKENNLSIVDMKIK